MIRQVEEELRNKLMKNGSHLTRTRTIGGGAAAMKATGLMLIVICWMLAAMLFPISKSSGPVFVLGALGTLFGLLLILLGVWMKSRRIAAAYSYYEKKSGYTKEQLQEFDREFADGTALFLSPNKKLNAQTLRDASIFTKHWVKLPNMNPVRYSGLYRTVDVAAAWYEPEPFYYKITRYNPSLITVDSRGELKFSMLDENTAKEFMDELLDRNPRIITHRHFADQNGQQVDAMGSPEAAAAAYRTAASAN